MAVATAAAAGESTCARTRTKARAVKITRTTLGQRRPGASGATSRLLLFFSHTHTHLLWTMLFIDFVLCSLHWFRRTTTFAHYSHTHTQTASLNVTHTHARSQALFASLIPEITDLVGRPNVYMGCYRINPVKKYVLCHTASFVFLFCLYRSPRALIVRLLWGSLLDCYHRRCCRRRCCCCCLFPFAHASESLLCHDKRINIQPQRHTHTSAAAAAATRNQNHTHTHTPTPLQKRRPCLRLAFPRSST